MRKRVFGRKFNRDTNERKLMFRSLMRSFILHGHIKTTESKAAAIRGEVEKLVTKAKRKQEGAFRDIMKKLPHEDIAQKLIREIAPVFADRPGGYTRVLRLGNRVKDAAPMVFLQWVDAVPVTRPISEKRKDRKTTTKKADVAVDVKEEVKGKKETKKKGK